MNATAEQYRKTKKCFVNYTRDERDRKNNNRKEFNSGKLWSAVEWWWVYGRVVA